MQEVDLLGSQEVGAQQYWYLSTGTFGHVHANCTELGMLELHAIQNTNTLVVRHLVAGPGRELHVLEVRIDSFHRLDKRKPSPFAAHGLRAPAVEHGLSPSYLPFRLPQLLPVLCSP